MDITITWGAWVVPTLITLIACYYGPLHMGYNTGLLPNGLREAIRSARALFWVFIVSVSWNVWFAWELFKA